MGAEGDTAGCIEKMVKYCNTLSEDKSCACCLATQEREQHCNLIGADLSHMT